MKAYKEFSRCYHFFAKFAWKTNKVYFAILICRFVIRTAGPFISILGTRYLIDELTAPHKSINTVVFWIGFLCIGNFLYQHFTKIVDEHLGRNNENFGRILETELCMDCTEIKFEHTEDKKVLDLVKNAQRSLNETGHVNGLMGPVFDILSNIIVLMGVVVLVCTSIPWLLTPVILSFISKTIVGKRINQQRKDFFAEIGTIERGSDYFNTELQDSRYAKDVRLYEASDIFNKNYDSFIDKLYACSKYYLKKIAISFCIDDSIVNFFTIIIYFLLGIYTLLKRITIGQFSSLYQATTQFNNSLHGIVRRYFDIAYTVNILKYYVDFSEHDFAFEDNEKTTEIDFKMQNNFSVEFKNVSFKYPRTERYILKNVSTKINAGEHLSIVGQNGAGKTTFIKLLCRLYDNYEGEILVNDVNIKEYSFEEYVKLLSVVFQDFRLFAFTLKENVTVFEKKEMDLNEIYQISGISEWIDSLEDGEDTYIYKYFVESGVEPSGGQGQKMAIARALYKDAPIVILDEPTAALDPISEYEVYQNFDELVHNKTAVYISHRLSSCKFCDRIIVFDDGRLIEEGSHEQLLAMKDGVYAKMYNTQAKQYQNSQW